MFRTALSRTISGIPTKVPQRKFYSHWNHDPNVPKANITLKGYLLGSLAFTSTITALGAYNERDTPPETKYKKIFFEYSLIGIGIPLSLTTIVLFENDICKLCNDPEPMVDKFKRWKYENFW